MLLGSLVAPAEAAPKRRTVARELDRLLAQGAIDQPTRDTHYAALIETRRTAERLTGTRRAQVAGALATVEGIAARGQLTAPRLAPLFLTLARNREWWTTGPLLASGQRIGFAGSELVWQHVPGQGLALHPLANFGKLNAYAKARRGARNDARVRLLLDELLAVAVPRGAGLAWEYYFSFSGGSPPWVSGLAQGTGLQAIARSAVRLGRLEELRPVLRSGLAVFQAPPPLGVRVRTKAGAHYAQYSFWPSLRVLNGFVQSLVGLYDVATLTGEPLARRLFAEGEAEARVDVPRYDTGAWSYYSRVAIQRESDLGYHTLLRDFLASLCDRTAQPVYCDAESHFTSYLTVPPALSVRTLRVRGGTRRALRFSLSKIARVSVRVVGPDGRAALTLPATVLGHGTRSISWAVPRKPGVYTVRLGAVDLAGNPGSAEGLVEVLRPKPRKKGRDRG